MIQTLFVIFVSASLVNNVILVRFLGLCPFMGVSRRIDTAVGMSLAVTFVMLLSSTVTWLLFSVLERFDVVFLQTIVFILVIAAFVQLVETVMRKTMRGLYQSLGIFLPLITTNCAILGVALINVQMKFGLAPMIVFSLGTSAGFGLAIVLFAGLRERMEVSRVPAALKGNPIGFITAGLLSLAFMGFSGIV